MTSIKVRGVNRVRSKGRIYHYHRATGARIQADPKDAVAFAAEVAVLNAERPRINLEVRPGTLGALITLYRRASAFVELAPDTQKGYQRAFDACKALDSMPLVNVNQALILGLQERIYRKKGRWLANMAVSVLPVVLGWGVPRGLTHSNAAGGVPKIRRPRSAPIANRAWTEREVQAALEAARGGLRKAIALAYYGGLRKKDVVELRASSRLNGMIDTTQSKTGNELSVYEAKKLQRS